MKKSKMSLEEATLKELQNQLNNEQDDEVEGIVDDVLVITDPEVTSEDYEDVIERAQEIVDDTPEGEIPFDDQYVGEVAQTCPICGATFTEDHLLEQGEPCPICLEQPDAFVLVGKLEADKTTLDDEIEEETDDLKDEPTDSENTEKSEKNTEEDKSDEENKEESKQVNGNVLTESDCSNKVSLNDVEKKEEADLSKDLYQDEANRRIHTRLEFLDVYLEKFEDALKNNDTDNITLNKSKIKGNIEYLIPALNIKGGVEGLIKYLTETDFDFENRFKETASLLRDATQETKTESKLNESVINQQTLLDTLSQVRNENKRDGLLGIDDFVLRCYEVYADLENKKNLTAEERNAINASAKDAYKRLEDELKEESVDKSEKDVQAKFKKYIKDATKSLKEKFMEFSTESDKEDYIAEHNLEINKDYKDKGPVAIELLKESAGVRDYTTKLLDDCEMGTISWESVARECLSYMSEDDVKDMAISAGFLDEDENEDDDYDELEEAKEMKTESEELVDQDEIIDAIQQCTSESDLETLISELSDEVLSTVLLNDLYDLKSEMDDNGGHFNYMTTYIDNLCNKVEDYFDDPEEYAAQLEENKKQESLTDDVLITDKVFDDLMDMESFIESNGFDVLDFDMRNEEVTVMDATKSDGISEVYKYEEQPDSTFKIIRKIKEEQL